MRYSYRSLAKPLAVLSIALVAPGAASAQPAVMTFTPIACATGYANPVASPYTEAGFTLTSSIDYQFGTLCADYVGSYAGPGMFIDYSGTTASLTKNGGGTFSIGGISLAHLYGGTWGDQSFTFIGNLYGDGTISQTFTIGAQAGPTVFTPYVFDATWTNLTSVTFASQDYPYYQFTNILLDGAGTTVPEPASMALLGTGLVGVFGAVRRRRNQSA
jgi:hypothetical protein